MNNNHLDTRKMNSMKLTPHSIQNRLKRLNIMFFSFILTLGALYSFQIFTFEKKINMMEHFEEFLQDILELRRYEKNMLLHLSSEDMQTIFFYIDQIHKDIIPLKGQMQKTSGNAEFNHFKNALKNYTARLRAYRQGLKNESDLLRPYESQMANYATHLLEIKRNQIKAYVKISLYAFTIIPGLGVIFVMLIIVHQTKNILNRISFLHQATQDVRHGKFTIIEDDASIHDEISDLTQSFNKMVAELDTKTSELIQSGKLAAIGTFSSGIAHELNNPLNNISLSADMLFEEYHDTTEEEAKDILRDILAQTDRAGKIVRNLLDFSRDKEPAVQKLRLCHVIASTKQLIENELRLKNVYMETWKENTFPYLMFGDFQKLQQVFLNLFINAIHAMPEGGLIHVDAHAIPGNFVRVDISDTGTGIPPEKIEKIFDPFFTTKEVGKGTGLGLSIVYGIIKKHGGYIEVESQMQIGTTFSVFLPYISESEAEIKHDSSCCHR